MLSPPYQPESAAVAAGLASAAITARLSVPVVLFSFILFSKVARAPYGAGTLITVLTIVTEALSASALPFSVVQQGLPGVENVVVAEEMIVPTMVPPPVPLMVAELPTCQKTFFGCAPPARMTLRGSPALPTVSVVAIWKIHTASGLPPASSVRSAAPVRRNAPVAVE